MEAIFSFLRSKQFLIHLGIISAVLIVLFFGIIKWLSVYTDHAEFVQVPDFKGLELNKLEQFIQDKQVSFEIIDSIYDPKQKPGTVLRQDPDPLSKVKHNRTVYLYVTGMVPPMITMPKLVDRSERQARLIITSYGLRPGKITEKGADCNGCVIAQLFKGKEISSGDKLQKGSVIDLIVGRKDNYYTSNAADTSKTEEVNFENEK